MKRLFSKAGLLSAAAILALVPATQALPKWLQPLRREADGQYAPRQYSVYENPGGYYTYAGYGPAPTISSTGSTSSTSGSESSGVETSSSAIYGCEYPQHSVPFQC